MNHKSLILIFFLPFLLNAQGKVIEHNVEGRKISVYLPPNYNSEVKHKLACFHDGQLLFTHYWNLQPILDELHLKNKIAPTIVVGIHNSGTRNDDLLPYMDTWIMTNWGSYIPKAQQFSKFIKKKIIPFVSKRYSISKHQEDRALFGASFGGLHALWDATQNPGYWGLVGALSGSFWVMDEAIFETARKAKFKNTKVWFDIGATTGEWNDYTSLLKILGDKGLEYGVDLYYFEVPNGRHIAEDWAARVHMPLILFAGTEPSIKKSLTVEIEIIQSALTDKVYKRINPIIQLSNGVKYSASSNAQYKLLNPEAGSIKEDGRFEFTGNNPLKVKVLYEDFEKEIIISPQK